MGLGEEVDIGQILLIAMLLIGVTITIHAVGSTHWLRFLLRRYADKDGNWHHRHLLRLLVSAGTVLLGLHAVEVLVWALAYLALPSLTELGTFEEAVYFSAVTFTTLGYGDITLGPNWRLLTAFEAMNGILLFGWTTALLMGVVQRSWKSAL